MTAFAWVRADVSGANEAQSGRFVWVTVGSVGLGGGSERPRIGVLSLNQTFCGNNEDGRGGERLTHERKGFERQHSFVVEKGSWRCVLAGGEGLGWVGSCSGGLAREEIFQSASPPFYPLYWAWTPRTSRGGYLPFAECTEAV